MANTSTRILGIDLAWQSEGNSSGIAIGKLQGGLLFLEQIYPNVVRVEEVVNIVKSVPNLGGVAIDAPLIIRNSCGQRPCEHALSKVYGGKRNAGAHSSNLNLYPSASSIKLSEWIELNGLKHMGSPEFEKWQLECYPHPAIIELFGLEERLKYKKGKAEQKRAGQICLAQYIRTLESYPSLPFLISSGCNMYLDSKHIRELQGARLKSNEDALDAIVCLFIAGLYAIGQPMTIFGDLESGYIVVPQVKPLTKCD